MVTYIMEFDVPKYFDFIQDEKYADILFCMSVLAKYRPQVYEHSICVCMLYVELSKLFESSDILNQETIIGVLLHDIGKISIDNELLYKANKLSQNEYEKIKEHVFLGGKIMKNLNICEKTKSLIVHHHERWDGNGYPKGLRTEEIPENCRLLAICDSIDAMTSERCYKRKLTQDECLNELINNSGTQFDPNMIKIIVKNFNVVRKYLR